MSREYISDHVKSILTGDESPFMKLLSLASQYDHVVTLGLGDPDLPTPKHIIAAAIQALEAGKTKYTPPVGLLELRQAVAKKYEVQHQLTYDPNSEIIITAGTQQGIFASMQTLLNPGDEMLIPEPYYACYAESAKMAGATVVEIPTRIEDDFEVTIEALKAKITPRTKVLSLISPSNPSGTVISRETMLGIAELVQEHDLVVVSDELYENVIYDDKMPTCFASIPGMRERTVVVNGVSKAYSMTGLRVGFMVGPKHLMKPMSVPHHAMVICANAVAQYAALAALTGPQDFLNEYRELYNLRRKIVMNILDEGGVKYGYPSGAFFVFADIRPTGLSSFDFCKGLLEAEQIQVFPGTMYGSGSDGFIRISCLAEKEVLEAAIRRLTNFYRTLAH